MARALHIALLIGWVFALATAGAGAPLPALALLGLGGLAFVGGLLAGRLPGRARLAALAGLDPFAGWRWLGMLALYLAIRAPLLLDPGVGSEAGAWRILAAARALWTTGTYQASRPPGLPLVEIGLAPVVGLGEVLGGKLVIALLGFAAIGAWDRLGRRLGAPGMGALSLALLLSPASTLAGGALAEAGPALLLLALALLVLSSGRNFWGGAALGLVAGARPEALLALPAALAWRRRAGGSWRDLGLIALTALEAVALVFLPGMVTYRGALLEGDEAGATLASGADLLAGLGLGPTLALGFALGATARGLEPGAEAARPARALAAGLLLVGVVDLVISSGAAGAALLALAAGGLLLALLDRPVALLSLALGGLLSLGLETGPGSLRGELAARAAQREAYHALRAVEVPERALVVVSGAQLTLARALGEDLRDGASAGWPLGLVDPATGAVYVGRLPERAFGRAEKEGRRVFVWNAHVDTWTREAFGYSPLDRGARLLEGDAPAGQGGGEASRWVVTPKKAEGRVRQEGERLTVDGWAVGPVRVCADPPLAAGRAGRVIGRARLRLAPPGTDLRVTVTWADAAGERLKNTLAWSATTAGEAEDLRVWLEPPAGAATAQLCAKLEGDGARAVLEDLRLAR